MKALLIIFCFGLWSIGYGQDSSFERGNEAYANADYETALNEYNKLVAAEQNSAELYYNLGNTYYKLNELGEAIWAYERSLKINPGDADAQFNLKFANEETYDEIDSSDSAIARWLRINFFSYSINLWSILSICFSLLTAVALYFFFTTQQQRIKNMGLTVGFGAAFLLILSISLAYFHKHTLTERDQGIIISEFVDVKTAPTEESAMSFTLHEGTKVAIMRSDADWTEIQVNGNAGWVPKGSVWDI